MQHIRKTSQKLKKKIQKGAKQKKTLEQLTPSSKLGIIFEKQQLPHHNNKKTISSPQHNKKRKTKIPSTNQLHNKVRDILTNTQQYSPLQLEKQTLTQQPNSNNTTNNNTPTQDLKNKIIQLKTQVQQLQNTLYDTNIQALNTKVTQLQQNNQQPYIITYLLTAILGISIGLTLPPKKHIKSHIYNIKANTANYRNTYPPHTPYSSSKP